MNILIACYHRTKPKMAENILSVVAEEIVGKLISLATE